MQGTALTPPSICGPEALGDRPGAWDGTLWVLFSPFWIHDHRYHHPDTRPRDPRDEDTFPCDRDPCGNTCPRTYTCVSSPEYSHVAELAS